MSRSLRLSVSFWFGGFLLILVGAFLKLTMGTVYDVWLIGVGLILNTLGLVWTVVQMLRGGALARRR